MTPTWSPDGSALFYSQASQLWRYDFGSGDAPLALTPASERCESPSWQPIAKLQVDIDVKPGSEPNCSNNNGHGVIPVAILGSADFDAADVDPATVALEGLAVRARGKGNKLLAHLEDVNEDGYLDLVVQIEDVDGTFAEGDTDATLTGTTWDGLDIVGTDSICIVP